MRTNLLIIYATVLSFLFIACENDFDKSRENNEISNKLSVSENFDWKTTKEVTFKISVKYVIMSNLKSRITFYDGNPKECGNIITTSFASDENPMSVKVALPAKLEEVYVTCQFPTGAETFTTFNVNAKELSCLFDERNIETPERAASLRSEIILPTSEDADVVLYGGSIGDIRVGEGKIYAIKRQAEYSYTQFSFRFESGGGTILVCDSTYTAADYFQGEDGTLIIEEGAMLSAIPNFYFTRGAKIYNFGEFVFNGDLECYGRIYNYGKLTVTGSLYIKPPGVDIPGGEIYNWGEIDVQGNTRYPKLSNSGKLFNYGYISTPEYASGGSFCILENHCQIITENDVTLTSASNYGYIYSGGKLLCNNNIQMYNGAMFNANNIKISKDIIGEGTYSKIYAEGQIELYDTITGNIDVTAKGGLIKYSNNYVNGYIDDNSVTLGELFLPITECNPVGAVIEDYDLDGDGILNNMDDYPTDPYRAYNSYFPNENSSATYAFEDLWPVAGDYDFNDLVIAFNGKYVLSADNKVVDLYIDYNVLAAGGTGQNGFGIRFDSITTSQITNISGSILRELGSTITLTSKGYEWGTTKPVAIAFERTEDIIHRVGTGMFNTEQGGSVGTSDTVHLCINFKETAPVDRNKLVYSDFNVFLFDSDERGLEVHLPDMSPTYKMTTSYLGTQDDDSDVTTGRYFKTEDNMPWGILTVENFQYPYETISILEAYANFASWAQSEGALNEDWYLYPVSGKVWEY